MNRYESFNSRYLLFAAQEAGKNVVNRKKSGNTSTKAFKKLWESYYEVLAELKQRGFSHKDPKWYYPTVKIKYDPRGDFVTFETGEVISGNSLWIIARMEDSEMLLKIDDFNRVKIQHIL